MPHTLIVGALDETRDRVPMIMASNNEPPDTGLDRQLGAILPLLGRHIAFRRRLVDVTSSVKAALFLSQAIYWTGRGLDVRQRGGWFMKTVAQWEMETGLSEREQLTVRKTLRSLAVLSEQRSGLPAKLHFRLDIDALASLLDCRAGRARGVTDELYPIALAQWLGPSTAYHRSLARVGQGVHAGLLLSRALQLAQAQTRANHTGWVIRTAAQWTDDLGLTRREQESARRDLAATGVWEEAHIGTPPRLAFRIRLEALFAQLASVECAEASHHQRGRCEERETSDAQNVGSSRWQPRVLVPTKPPTQFLRNRRASSDESAIPVIQSSTSISVQLPYKTDAVRSEPLPTATSELVFPEGLNSGEQAAARRLVEPCGPLAQCILDELAGRMDAKAVRTTPISYLRGLVAHAAAGKFVADAGLRVEATRRRRQLEARQRLELDAEEQRLTAERASPGYHAKMSARRAEIAEWLDRLQPKRSGGRG